jgi:hypothetical protein
MNINVLKAALSNQFKMSDLGTYYFYLGMKVTRDRPRRILQLSQEAYLQKVLRDHSIENCQPVKTPMDTHCRLMPAEPGYKADPAFKRAYQSAVGSLMYAMLGTRPHIAFTVLVISCFSANPTEAHIAAVKRVFRYLKDIVSMGLVFRRSLQPLSGYTNSDWAGDPDTRCSTSGYVFNLGSAAISWSSKR